MNAPKITDLGKGKRLSFLVKAKDTADLIAFLRKHLDGLAFSVHCETLTAEGKSEDEFTIPTRISEKVLKERLTEFYQQRSE